MNYFTKEDMEKLLEDEEVVSHSAELMAMDGAAYFEEVRSRLSPGELGEYLNENLDERIHLEKWVSIRYIHHVKERLIK